MSKQDFDNTVIEVNFTDMTFSRRAIATAEELASEIVQRIDAQGQWSIAQLATIRQTTIGTLLDWFNGDLNPGASTDPPRG